MAEKSKIGKLNIGSPAIYRIRVQGNLNLSWALNLNGMQITKTENADDTNETLLVGRLEDQAALAGVIETLYNLQMPVLSVECLEKL
jgi:hypothetical protein